MKACILAVAGVILAGSLTAETVYYVDGTNGRDEYDGKAAQWDGTHGPKRVIQDAVNLFGAGGVGTIKVLPGVYGDDQGYAFATNKASGDKWGDGSVRCRVFIADRRLRIESTEGAEKTHIVGKWSASDTGLGTDAVRCFGVGLGPAAAGVVIKGFTLRDGATPNVNNAGQATGNGGAVGTDRTTRQVYVVDCVVSNCVAYRAGALFQATAIRSVFTHCDSSVNGGSVAFRSDFYASAAFNNGSYAGSQYEALLACPNITHCALFSNAGGEVRVSEGSGRICNSVFANVQLDYATRINGSGSSLTVSNCAFRVDGSNREIIGDAGKTIIKGNIYNITANPYVMVSPWELDFRPVKGSVIDGAGLVSVSSPDWVPQEFRGVGLDGQPLVVGGKAPIGPVAGSVEMAGGFLVFQDATTGLLPAVEGSPAQIDTLVTPGRNNLYYIGSETWPRQVRARARSTDPDKVALCFTQSGVPGVSTPPRRWCSRDNSVALTFPPAGVVFAHAPVWATSIIYCAPDGLDANDGQTDKKPMTINGACKAATDATLVIALPGTYAGDPVTARSVATRANVTVGGTLLRSRDGAGKTIIKGVHATDAQGTPTYGDSSVRCLCLAADTCAQGFTLADGGVVRNENSDYGSGGGVLGADSRSVLMDSVITNCYSSRGICRNAWSVRCRYVGNWGYDQAVIREANASSCEFFSNTLPAGYAMTFSGAAYGCSFFEPKYNGGKGSIINGTMVSAYNCVVGGSSPCYHGTLSGHEYIGCFSMSSARSEVTVSSVLFADAENGDLRLRSDSPAIGGGDSAAALPTTEDGGTNAKADWARFTTDDIEGNLVRFRDGKPTAGARQRAAQMVELKVAAADEVTPSGVVAIGEEGSLTVSVTASSKRRYLGYELDGVFTPTDVRQFTLTAPAFPCGIVTARAVFSTDWYVNAEADYADDTNDGWTPETARKTLVEGVKDAVPGDVVHLARGTYATGKDLFRGGSLEEKVYARVVVPAGVTLRGDEGPDGVIIKGAKASETCEDYAATCGTGWDAIRCVILSEDAKLEGVTLTDGHSGSSNSKITGGGYGQNDNYAGGVLGRNTGNELVSHCVITNCGGGRAGGVAKVVARACYIAENRAEQGAAGRNAGFYGCVLKDNHGPNPIVDVPFLVDSTFISPVDCNPTIGKIDKVANSVIVCARDMGFGDAACDLVNTVICSEHTIPSAITGAIRLSTEEMMLGERGIPAKDSPLVDWAAGRTATEYDAAYGVMTDPFGVPRVLNDAKQDLGGAEYDWRADYGRDLCPRKVAVSAVAPQAKELADGRVSLPVGELVLDWSAEKSRTVMAEVTGTGVLALYRDGGDEPIRTWTKDSDAPYRLRDAAAVAANLRFVYTPGVDDDGGAVLGPFSGTPGLLLTVR